MFSRSVSNLRTQFVPGYHPIGRIIGLSKDLRNQAEQHLFKFESQCDIKFKRQNKITDSNLLKTGASIHNALLQIDK